MTTAKLDALIKCLERRYVNNYFTVSVDKNISAVINVPASVKGGVYIIYASKTREIVYIGKAGSITQKGYLKKQGLRKRLMAKQTWKGKKYRRNRLFKIWIKELKQPIKIKWFVSFDEHNKIAPAKLEIDLLQTHYAVYGKLPKWNKIL